MDALGINLGYLFVQIFNFTILFLVLRAWVYEPILNMLETRRKSIEQGLEDARVAAEARASAEEDAKKILAEAQDKAAQVTREATGRADASAKDIIVAAEGKAAEIRAEALDGIDQERSRILSDLRGQVAALAMAATQKLVGETLDEKRQRALIDEFFSGIKKGAVVILPEISVAGASAEVTSALPLNDAEKDTVKQDVLAKLGGQATVTFREDPSILGGLVIQVGDKVLDGSVAGKLNAMRESLQ